MPPIDLTNAEVAELVEGAEYVRETALIALVERAGGQVEVSAAEIARVGAGAELVHEAVFGGGEAFVRLRVRDARELDIGDEREPILP